MGNLPLSRFTVLDLTRVRSGPAAVRQFADWGANVIKIEEPSTEKDDRPGGSAQFADYQNTHRNKKSITLNLKSAKGKALFMQLVKTADVVVENYRPNVKFKLGIDYESLKLINPKIILASVSGFGQDGPYKDRPGLDQIAQGIGGLMSVTGEPEHGPMRAGIPVADLTAGLCCAMGILTALLEREVSGEGQWVQTSLLQSQIWMMDFQAMRWLMNREIPGQSGNDHPTSSPTGMFPTLDGYMNIAAMGNDMFKRLCTVLELDHLVTDERFLTVRSRVKNRFDLNAAISERTKTKKTDVWITSMNAMGVPCGPILTLDKTFENPQVKHLELTRKLNHPSAGEISVMGPPIIFSRSKVGQYTPAPERGQHNGEILGSLGLSADEISALHSEGIV